MVQVVKTVAASADDAHDTFNGNFPGYSHSETYFFTGIPGGNSCAAGLRFTSLGIPSGATITGVSLELEDVAFSGGDTVVDVGFEDVADAAQFSSGDAPVDRTMTTDKTTAHALAASEDPPPGLRTVATQGMIDSLQELVDTYGAIDNVVLLLVDNGSSDFNEWRAVDAGSGNPAELTVDYTASSGNVTISSVVASASADAPTPTVSYDHTVASVVAAATAAAPAPTSDIQQTVQSVVAEATTAALTPTIRADNTVASVVAEATATAPAPGLSTGSSATVESVVAAATATAPIPAIVLDSSVSSVVSSAAAEALAPTVSIVQSVTVESVVAQALAVANTPAILGDVVIESEPATAVATALAPPAVGELGSQRWRQIGVGTRIGI